MLRSARTFRPTRPRRWCKRGSGYVLSVRNETGSATAQERAETRADSPTRNPDRSRDHSRVWHAQGVLSTSAFEADAESKGLTWPGAVPALLRDASQAS